MPDRAHDGPESAKDPIDYEGVVDLWRREFDLEAELGHLDFPEADAWVSLAQAEAEAGVSRSSLRAWYRTGQIPSRLSPGPHGLQRLVPLGAVLQRANRSARIGRGTSSSPAAATATTAAKEAQQVASTPPLPENFVRLVEVATASATERAERAEARADATDLALRAALERAASAEAEVRLLRERLNESR